MAYGAVPGQRGGPEYNPAGPIGSVAGEYGRAHVLVAAPLPDGPPATLAAHRAGGAYTPYWPRPLRRSDAWELNVLADISQKLLEPARGGVERLAALHSGELYDSQLISVLLVLAD